jgi:Arc/MetJ-type ribon-helix-helix transcriptional regulator
LPNPLQTEALSGIWIASTFEHAERKRIYFYIFGLMGTKTLSVKVDAELREHMRRLKHVNWSEVIRESIRKKIEEENGRNIAEAVLLNERLRKAAPEGWDSTKVIREWRSKR